MHGLIFAALRAYGAERLGATEALWPEAEYRLDEAYDDSEFGRRLDELRRELDEPVDEVLRGFGIYAGTTAFADLYPDYYAANAGACDFLLGIEERIHEVVRETLPGAVPPKLHIRPLGDDGVLISYTSERHLCRLLEGLVAGVAAHYGERLELEELQCMLRGDPGCVFSVLPAAPA